MKTSDKPTDAELLSGLAERLQERQDALQQAALVHDELRAVNARLEAAERVKGQFLSNIRNEINNPLTTLRGFAAAIADNPDLSREQVCQMASIIHREVGSLSFQMQNIFAAADLESGLVDCTRTRWSVNGLIAEAVSDLRSAALQKEVEVCVEEASRVVGVTDSAKLGLIVSNLLHNAIEFARSKVTVRVGTENDEVIIDVIDDGPGIREADREHVFDRFVQLSEGSTKSHPGHGLGLSVSRAFAEFIDASIEVRPSDCGSHFRVRLPLGDDRLGGEPLDEADQFLFGVVETF